MTWDEWKAQAVPMTFGGLEVATYDLGPGDGPTLTYLHGYPAASNDVAAAYALLDGWRLVTLDLPGFGASAKRAGHRYSVHAAADAVEDLWRGCGVDRTVLAAHDYSVSVTQELLARGHAPSTIAGVVWMNGGVYPDLHRPTVGQQLLLDPESGPALAAALDEAMFAGGIEQTWGTRRPMTAEDAHGIWASMDEGGGVARMHDLLHYIADRREHADRWRAALEETDVPMAFVWGDLDPVSGAHMIERVQERRPGATFVRLADVGHWPPLEAPAEVAAAIEALR